MEYHRYEYLRYEVYLVNLDPTIGSEIKKTRPCIIISPNEMNKNISTIIIAPLTSTKRNYPTRINCRVQPLFNTCKQKEGWKC